MVSDNIFYLNLIFFDLEEIPFSKIRNVAWFKLTFSR